MEMAIRSFLGARWRTAATATMLLAFTAGCGGGHIVPTTATFPIRPGTTREFRSTQKIAFVNAHLSGEPFVLKLGISEYTGDRKDWTQTAIEYLKGEVEGRGMQVANDAAKRVTLTIISQRVAQEGNAVRCVVYFRVQTADGYATVVYGNNLASRYMAVVGESLVRQAVEGALQKVVVAILNDAQLINYMK